MNVAETSKEARLGRKPKPEALKRKNRVVLLFTDDEQAALDRHIEEQGFADRNDFGRKLILDQIGYKRGSERGEA
ncbi:hypothetical protein RA27_02425 [Ruegeria sp. ANG-R]|uniref:hypothetical protein n=1 Tax=Ruegeria sp. ANG-R TaxID=1577903 RepID=UPI00057E2CC1|nr:hypothetical protein [Ruegeria sp. ANG-R]KIC42259.1 hypothetical protein RA27_02425 [Ruegeria sp. ANG-R]